MNIQEHFLSRTLSATINPEYAHLLRNLNFDGINSFVKDLLNRYLKKVPRMTFFSDIHDEHYTQNDTMNFLTHIVEIGSLKFIFENDLVNRMGGLRAANFSNEVLDYALATNLSKLGFLNRQETYFGSSISEIEQRVFNFLSEMNSQGTPLTKNIVDHYLKNFLFNKV